MSIKSLNVWGSLSQTGYGVVTLNLAQALIKQGLEHNNLYLTLMGQYIHANDTNELNFVKQHLEMGKFCPIDTPLLKIWHQFQLMERIGKGPYMAMPIFELTHFNKLEKHHLKFPDYLIVNSRWAKDIIRNEIDRGAFVVPLGVNTDIFKPVIHNNTKTYNFINISKIEVRKGHDILVDIFNKAFTKDDDVALNIMWHNPFLTKEETQQWINKYKESPLGNKIYFLEPVSTHYELAKIIQQCDCGIFPSRGEGWDLEVLETMACGKPVITTNYSGHTEYCNNENAYLVNIDSLEDAYDGKWFHGQGQWAHIGADQIDQMVEYMRYMYENRPSNETGIQTGKKFTWENSAKTLLELDV